MTNKNYSDHDIEHLLNQMPKLEDQRSKDDIWKQIKQSPTPPPKKPKPWLPAVISIAALFVLVLFIQSLQGTMSLSKSEDAEESRMTQEASMQASDESESAEEEATAEEGAKESGVEEEAEADSSISNTMLDSTETNGLVFENDPLLTDFTVMKFSLVDYNAIAIPATVLIPNSQIVQDFGGEQPTQLDLYLRYASEIDEEALGFSDYHPYSGTIAENDNGLVITLPEDHLYDMASAASGVYMHTLEDIFSIYSQAAILNEQGDPIEWDQVGILEEPVELSSSNYAYSVIQNANGESYLVPYTRSPYDTFSQAIDQLQNPDNSIVNSVIPDSIPFSVDETEEVVTITFDEMLTSESSAEQNLQIMIEAFVATAASFDKSIRFENWDPVIYPDLPEDTTTLVGINKLIMTLE